MEPKTETKVLLQLYSARKEAGPTVAGSFRGSCPDSYNQSPSPVHRDRGPVAAMLTGSYPREEQWEITLTSREGHSQQQQRTDGRSLVHYSVGEIVPSVSIPLSCDAPFAVDDTPPHTQPVHERSPSQAISPHNLPHLASPHFDLQPLRPQDRRNVYRKVITFLGSTKLSGD